MPSSHIALLVFSSSFWPRAVRQRAPESRSLQPPRLARDCQTSLPEMANDYQALPKTEIDRVAHVGRFHLNDGLRTRRDEAQKTQTKHLHSPKRHSLPVLGTRGTGILPVTSRLSRIAQPERPAGGVPERNHCQEPEERTVSWKLAGLVRFTEWRPRDAGWQFGSHGGAASGDLIG
jgi:hypothetical protein